MEIPFKFGKIVTGNDFANRVKELRVLNNFFLAGTNVIIISPRRWGKSSLVIKAAEKTLRADNKFRYCYIDLFNIKTEEEFYTVLTQEVLRAVSSNAQEILSIAGKFFTRLIPQITFSPDRINTFSVGLDWKEVKKQPDEILNLAEKAAQSKKFKLLICIDEFQNVSEFTDPLKFQKKLRANWQRHSNVSYCLFGSKRNMMQEVFASQSMPLYKFGEIMFLEKISLSDWINYIQSRFKDTGKNISDAAAANIPALVDCHPYYVQQLAQQSWLRTQKKCSVEIVDYSYESLVKQLSLLFQQITDELTSTQVNYLRAVINNIEHLSSAETIEEYNLGTSANIARIKSALIRKDIIDIQEKKVEFLDPVYKEWLKKDYFSSPYYL